MPWFEQVEYTVALLARPAFRQMLHTPSPPAGYTPASCAAFFIESVIDNLDFPWSSEEIDSSTGNIDLGLELSPVSWYTTRSESWSPGIPSYSPLSGQLVSTVTNDTHRSGMKAGLIFRN